MSRINFPAEGDERLQTPVPCLSISIASLFWNQLISSCEYIWPSTILLYFQSVPIRLNKNMGNYSYKTPRAFPNIIHTSHNALVPHPTDHNFEHKYAYLCCENGVLWDMEQVSCGICNIGRLRAWYVFVTTISCNRYSIRLHFRMIMIPGHIHWYIQCVRHAFVLFSVRPYKFRFLHSSWTLYQSVYRSAHQI